MSVNEEFVLGVIGVRDLNGRVYTNSNHVNECLDRHVKIHGLDQRPFRIVTGGGRGAEALVVTWAKSRSIPLSTTPPNIQDLGAEKAFQVRNTRIVKESNSVVLFWDGFTNVTIAAIVNAVHAYKEVTIYPIK